MLSSLTRLFQPSTSSLATPREREQDPLAGAEAGYSEDDTTRRSNDIHSSLDAHSDSTPLLTRKQSSQFASSISTSALDSHYPGPPHVQWKTPGGFLQKENGRNSPTKSLSGMSMLNTPTTPGHWPGAQPMGRSASSPSLLLSSLPNAPGSAHRPTSSLGRQSCRSLRLGVDSMYASEDSDVDSEPSSAPNGNGNGNGNGAQALPKQLSPIHEQQVPFPPHRKVSLDSVPRTPDSTRTFDRFTGQNAFINRPLKRSLSQTSTSTHRSNISAAPPVIPPLDLRPNFQTAMGVPPSRGPLSPPLQLPLPVPIPRKSRLAQPSLPMVVGSPSQTNKVSVIYEDGASSARSSSFVTAPSVSLSTPVVEPGGPQRFSFGPNVYLDPSSFASDSARDEELDTDACETEEETEATHRPLPSGLYDEVDLTDVDTELMHVRLSGVSGCARPRNPTPPSIHSRPHSQACSRTPLRISSHTRSSAGDSFFDHLDSRWLKDMFLWHHSERFVRPGKHERRQGRRAELGATYACILFWVGFVMPWCWLIGGWLLTRDGEVPEEERGPLLPLWHRMRKGRSKSNSKSKPESKLVAHTDADTDTATATAHTGDAGQRQRLGVETDEEDGARRRVADVPAMGTTAEKRLQAHPWYPLFAPSLESLAPSTRSGCSTLRLKPSRRPRRADPWIRRCRVAAGVSGLIIFCAAVVAIIVVAGVRP